MTIIRRGTRVRLTQVLEGLVTDYTPDREISIETDNAGTWVFELPLEEGVYTLEVLGPNLNAGDVLRSRRNSETLAFVYWGNMDTLRYVTSHGSTGGISSLDIENWELVR